MIELEVSCMKMWSMTLREKAAATRAVLANANVAGTRHLLCMCHSFQRIYACPLPPRTSHLGRAQAYAIVSQAIQPSAVQAADPSSCHPPTPSRLKA